MNGVPSIQSVLALRSRHAEKLRESWQFRLLVADKDLKTFNVIVCMLAHSYYEAMEILLRVSFPGFVRLELPLFTGTARIVKTGQIVCDLIDRRGDLWPAQIVYEKEDDMTKTFRDLADQIKLNDAERIALFAAIQNWVVADFRIKPSVETAA